MKGMIDWNKLTMEQYTEHLEEKFKFDSSGTAKAVFELINAYKALLIPRVSNHVFCPHCGNERELIVETDINSNRICKSRLCKGK